MNLRAVSKFDYIALAAYSAIFVFASLSNTLSGDAQAEMTNIFATISGVLLALYFVVDQPRQRFMVTLLLLSILVSLSSSVSSLGTPAFRGPFYSPENLILGNRLFFAVSAFFFALSTFSFGISARPRKRS